MDRKSILLENFILMPLAFFKKEKHEIHMLITFQCFAQDILIIFSNLLNTSTNFVRTNVFGPWIIQVPGQYIKMYRETASRREG